MTGEVADFFSGLAGAYGDVYEEHTIHGYFLRRRREIVFAQLDREPPRSLLDIGCGAGTYAKGCVARGITYSGIDVSPGMIARCNSSLAGESASFQVGSAFSLPFSERQFQVSLLLGVLEYLNWDDQNVALAEARRVTVRGGHVILSFANHYSPFRRWIAFKNGGQGSSESGFRDYTPHSYRTLLRGADLIVEGAFPCAINPFIPPLARKFPRAAVATTHALDWAQLPVTGRYAMAHVVLARTAT